MSSSPKQYLTTLRPKGYTDVFSSGEPTLGTVERKAGQYKARAALIIMMGEVLRYFNVTETMNDVQVAATVDFILEDYYFLQIDDIKLCFRNAMKGYYGKVYNRLDGQIILSWLHAYADERIAAAEHEAQLLAAERRKREQEADLSVCRADYIERLRRAADAGNAEAQAALEASRTMEELLRQVARRPCEVRMEKERARRARNRRELNKKLKQMSEMYDEESNGTSLH